MEENYYIQSYQKPNKFISLALTFGSIAIITSIFMSYTIIIPLVMGSLAILFAILSKSNMKKYDKTALIGLWAGVGGIVIQVVLVAFTYYQIFSNEDTRREFLDAYKQVYESIYGETFEVPSNDNKLFENINNQLNDTMNL